MHSKALPLYQQMSKMATHAEPKMIDNTSSHDLAKGLNEKGDLATYTKSTNSSTSLPSSIDNNAHIQGQVQTIEIDPAAERAVLRKFDKYLLPQAFLFILLNYLDRSNLGNARVFGFEKDIGLVNNQFGNLGLFYPNLFRRYLLTLLQSPCSSCHTSLQKSSGSLPLNASAPTMSSPWPS